MCTKRTNDEVYPQFLPIWATIFPPNHTIFLNLYLTQPDPLSCAPRAPLCDIQRSLASVPLGEKTCFVSRTRGYFPLCLIILYQQEVDTWKEPNNRPYLHNVFLEHQLHRAQPLYRPPAALGTASFSTTRCIRHSIFINCIGHSIFSQTPAILGIGISLNSTLYYARLLCKCMLLILLCVQFLFELLLLPHLVIQHLLFRFFFYPRLLWIRLNFIRIIFCVCKSSGCYGVLDCCSNRL